MVGFIISFAVGILCLAMGISIMRGNISLIHSYHIHRVAEKDKPALCRKVGIGMLIIGCAVAICSVLMAVMIYTEKLIFLWSGIAVLAAGLVSGFGISFYAIIKYNKGLF